jgi:hypothetical protein
MSTLNYLTSGLVQLNTPSSTISGITSAAQNSSSNTTATQPDCNIYPVGNTINPVDVIYHEQTVLMVNSTVNQNSNTVTAQYFDPVCGTPNNGSGFGGWNFDLCASSYLSGTMASSALLPSSAFDDELSLFSNMQPSGALNGGTGKHFIDITNGSSCAPGTGNPISYPGLFFSLTSQPYYTYSGSVYGGVNNSGAVTNANVAPGFTGNYNSYNFLFTSSYYVQQKNEIILVELLFTVSNSDATCYGANSASGSPTLSVIVKNKILTQNALASLSTDSSDATKVKVYSAGPIPLQYMLSGSTWNSKNFYYSIQNNVPIIIAPGYTKLYVTLPIAYVPAAGNGAGWSMNQNCYNITGSPTVPTFNVTNGIDTPIGYVAGPPPTATYFTYQSGSTSINYGHFIIGTAYSYDYNTYQSCTHITAEVLIKNIWKSPIAVYNTYKQFSVNDMATKQIVLLFGRNVTGGTFLVLNTGTPLGAIHSYAVTSLRNFVSIMRAIINLFDGSVSIVDYFINVSTIAQVNQMGSYNINVLVLQPLLDGAIQNPPSVANCPGMWYLMLNSKNSFNMAIDPSEQLVFGQQIGFNYFSLPNSILCATGNCMYMQTGLNILTDDQGDLFGNSLSLGVNVINSNSYYIVIILPEAQFYPTINTAMPNTLTIYSTPNTLFYVMVTPNSGSQFSPSSNTTITSSTKSSTGTSASTLSFQPTYSIQKVILSVSNTKLF